MNKVSYLVLHLHVKATFAILTQTEPHNLGGREHSVGLKILHIRT